MNFLNSAAYPVSSYAAEFTLAAIILEVLGAFKILTESRIVSALSGTFLHSDSGSVWTIGYKTDIFSSMPT